MPLRRRLPIPALAATLLLLTGWSWPSSGVNETETTRARVVGADAPDAPSHRIHDVDLTSVDAVIEALYASISGPAGAPRDWELFHLLMHPGAARLISMDVDPEGRAVHRVMTPESFVESADGSLVANGFFEREIGFTQERFGNMVHRFSAYDSKRTLDDPEPFSRGINSIQLLWDQGRWWIVTILWDRERADNPIPASMLHSR